VRHSLSLLLVEDDRALSEELRIFLSDFFDRIDAYDSAEDAYEQYQRQPYDMVMTDIQLPQQNGLNLVEKIKKKNPSQMVIVISAYKETDYFLKSIDLGIFSFLTKPFDSQHLINTMIKATTQLHAHQNVEVSDNLDEVVLHEGVVFHWGEKTLHVSGKEEELTPKEEVLLALLVKRANTFVRNEQIAQEVWQSDEVNNSTLRALVKRLRDKLGYENSIINLKNRGYKLNTK
jgi:DNA-binding response OmpR family regulator